MHVIVFEDGIPVEIQVRTRMQDVWAQTSEKLGDMWGRGLRYGLGPDDPDTPVVPGDPPSMTRGELIGMMAKLGNIIDQSESHQVKAMELSTMVAGLPADRAAPLRETIAKAEATANASLAAMESVLGILLKQATDVRGSQ